jgi:hypothetical protein
VENAELDVALEELENRLERLRALYEQYFMGIERIEPQIPRKDIDRRIYVLRREKIRNTAKRFKLQTIISRYNTFQQYWQRICREIENGTYKRHVIRAERIAPGQLLTIAARKRLGRHAFDDVEAESAPADGANGNDATAAISSAPPPPSVPAAPSSALPRSSAPPGVPRPASTSAPTAKVGPPPKPPPKPQARPDKPPPPSARPPEPARAFESLDLDMDFMGDWDPTAAAAKAPPAARPPARPFGEALARPLGSGPATAPAGNASRQTAGARAPQPSKPDAAAPRPAPVASKPAAPPSPPSAGTGRSPASVGAARLPAAPAAKATPPVPASPPAQPPPAAPTRQAESGTMAAKSSASAPTAKLGAAPIAKPAGTKPAASPAGLTDDRVRELHARLVEAKRQTQDAGSVSVEGLAKSLKATEAKLREQHKNRRIDFDVVIKDGKAVLKPIVR